MKKRKASPKTSALHGLQAFPNSFAKAPALHGLQPFPNPSAQPPRLPNNSAFQKAGAKTTQKGGDSVNRPIHVFRTKRVKHPKRTEKFKRTKKIKRTKHPESPTQPKQEKQAKPMRIPRFLARGRLLTVSATLPNRNVELLLLRLSAQKIPVLGLKSGKKGIKVKVRAQDYPLAFAIFGRMCYTVSEEQVGGFAAPLLFALRQMGVTLGVMLFFALSFLSRPIIFRVEFSGSAAFRAEELQAVLTESGITPFRAVSEGDIKNAERELLAAFPSLWFVSLEKRGFYLTVTAETAPTRVEIQPCYLLVTPKGGILKSLTVLQGLPLVAVGETVAENQPLVKGVLLVGEGETASEVPTPVIAQAVLACEFYEERTYPTENPHLLNLLIKNALKSVGADAPQADQSSIQPDTQGYRYCVKFTYLLTITGGNSWKKVEEE